MKVGYARVSSTDQNLDRQLLEMKQAGAELQRNHPDPVLGRAERARGVFFSFSPYKAYFCSKDRLF